MSIAMDARDYITSQGGKLEKANLIYLNTSDRELFRVPVQFNPSQYTIRRGMEYNEHNGIGQESSPSNATPVKGSLATLTVDLTIDAITAEKSQSMFSKLKKYITKENGLKDLIGIMTDLMKYDFDEHQPHKVLFDWGTLHFLGRVTSMSMNYTMFSPEGKPVRAKVNMSIQGEEKDVLKDIKANPPQSPDRTKYRSLGPVDELWMLAEQEYDDASAWRVIAKENGILNPRKTDNITRLKIPSI